MASHEHDDLPTGPAPVISSPRSSIGVMSPPPAYAPDDSPPDGRSRRPAELFDVEDGDQMKFHRWHFMLTTADIRVFTAVTCLHLVCKVWWLICILVGVFTPVPYTPAPFNSPARQEPIVRERPPPYNPGQSHRNIITQTLRKAPVARVLGDHNSCLRMAIAAIVITLCISLVKVGMLRRMKTKERYNKGLDRILNGDLGDKGKLLLGSWWERYVQAAHWVGAVDEILGLVLTVSFMGRPNWKMPEQR
ncbi:hypothetical protein TWF730_007077 [Orbilia blumenaviensis]|uniref:Uncharacterized protein n=1 Tax=Orbilia blumenaviensis TaxID=1796055 RepID=A0AAV9VHM2_9PEZI